MATTSTDPFASITNDYTTAQKASGQTDAQFAQSQGGVYNNMLLNQISSTSDPAALQSQLTQAQGQLSDPTYAAYAQARIDAINARQGTLNQQSPSGQQSQSAPAPAAPTPNPYPTTGVQSGNAGQDTNGNLTTPQNQSVESRIPGLLSSDNPIVQTQVGQATMAANARGLQNSTLAVQAGQQAAEASVLPIASQDAAQTAAQNLSAQGASQSGALGQQQISGTLANTGLQTQSAQTINTQNVQATAANLNTQITANQQLLTQSLGSQANLQAAQIAANALLQGQQITATQANLVLSLANTLQNTDLQTKANAAIATMQNTSTVQGQINSGLATAASNYQAAVANINSNTAMTDDARTTALAQAQQSYDNSVNFISTLYSVQLTWTDYGPSGGIKMATGASANSNATTTGAAA